MKPLYKSIGWIIGLSLLALAFLTVPQFWLIWRANRLVGASEAKVTEALGKPYRIITLTEVSATPPGKPWWGDGWTPHKPLPNVRNKALFYFAVPIGVIIFVGPNGDVENVSRIGT